MLINHNLKSIFLHCPKCAGISVSNWLKDEFNFQYFNDPEERIPDKPFVERHRFDIPEEFKDYQAFTTTREPFIRWESFYLFSHLYMDEKLGFEEFTKEKHINLPLQKIYIDAADLVFSSANLEEELLQLPFVTAKNFPIPRMNESKSYAGYKAVKDSVGWNAELREIIYEHFKEDFDLLYVNYK
ncbi:hypothetical protein Pan241w_04250 [Gimesia alba]|uniref:Sulfotransferase family protein n=1 Tax=Gimesia alba TaxID=2527973 RepID=A0A517R904_9PLAN|nr:hypothetical protein [Gimesia alba]QDT40369.1 hypothetical protein Pan241w_04250 [Gimesia alba]